MPSNVEKLKLLEASLPAEYIIHCTGSYSEQLLEEKGNQEYFPATNFMIYNSDLFGRDTGVIVAHTLLE